MRWYLQNYITSIPPNYRRIKQMHWNLENFIKYDVSDINTLLSLSFHHHCLCFVFKESTVNGNKEVPSASFDSIPFSLNYAGKLKI